MSSTSQIHWGQCDKCGEHYGDDLNAESEWCKPCQAKYLKENFANWTSGNENIDGLIQEMRSKIDGPSDIVFEWIPYNQFDNIREDVKGNSSKVYSAIWKDGPLSYSYLKRKLTRVSGKKVALKCVFNLQYNIDEIINEVKIILFNLI
uniref:Protein kinase domain-containing protein n=1 Tax=Rhizophagus irregularis (strain DAOM 181602 / DAOM 197198 / MUCL 43194) TaxID=747089 RepID=U9SVN9_RHIID